MNAQLDIVIRFHDIARWPELSRCVFSLIGQTYRPLRVIVATQRFSAEQVERLKGLLAGMIDGETGFQFTVVNWDHADPIDARSVLLNLGVGLAQGKYLAFLDYDDVMYQEAYELLVDRARKTGAAIVFASVRVMRLDVYETFFYTAQKVKPPYSGKTLADLFRNNFCPIQSYLIDRDQVDRETLTFNTALTMQEDYDVLLKICARYPSDFSLIGTEIADYYYKTDGSNTVPTDGGLAREHLPRFAVVQATIEQRREKTVVVPAVQRALGVAVPDDDVTIATLLRRLS